MNTTNTFFNRDQSIAKVNMAMNYLSRLVRENMTIFDYDAHTSTASFLTNSDKLVKCVVVSEGSNVFVKDIAVDSASQIFSNAKIDETVDTHVSNFIDSLRSNEYGGAEKGFSDLLGAFEGRAKINESRSKLERRRGHFTDSQDILQTPEFTKLHEVRDAVVAYIAENKESLLEYEDVVNSIKLTNALGKAFNSSRKTWDELVEEGHMVVPYDSKKTVYEMICTQELIRSELTESKENFARSWVKNPKISALASCIYNNDESVESALIEAVNAVPYLALASKADIKEVFASIYESSDIANISQKDIREYVARIFEFKKPIKIKVIKELNESYGINVQNLKFIPSFANLAKAQSVLFEALSKVGSKDTVVKDVFSDVSRMLRKKNGIEALDMNDFIASMFTEAKIDEDHELFREVELDSVVTDVMERRGGDKKGDKSNVKKDMDDKGDYETGMRKGDKSNVKKKKGDKGDFETGARKGDKSNVKKDMDDKGDYETGARKGDKGDGSHPDRKDFETEKGNSNFGGNKGDKSKTHKGKDFDQKWGGNKGDKSKTHPGELDYEDDDAKKKDEFPLAKEKNGKKKKKKNGDLTDKEADAMADQTAYDESIEYAEPEEEQDLGSGLSDSQMTDLMSELEDLFKEIDWEAVANDEEEEDFDNGLDYEDEMNSRGSMDFEETPNEFSDEQVGTPTTDEAP